MNTDTHTHTAGPWMYATGEDWDGAHVTDKHGRIVADCQGCDIPGTCGEVGTDEAEANARLIAAAPELLEALKVAESELRYHAATRNSEALEIVRAAIQKATGGEQ